MATIADVAQAAGVSISTVSYAMSGRRKISEETRRRIARAIADLDYSPNAGARSLASRATLVLGLQAPLRTGVDVHVVMEIVAGVVNEARAHGYDLLLLTSDDALGLERAAQSSMVDGLLVMDVESQDPRIAALTKVETPSVLIGLPSGAENLPCVDFDFEAAGRLAVARLVALGHRRVALLGSPPEVMARHTSYADRLAYGFLTACTAAGITGSVHPCPSSTNAVAVLDGVTAADPSVTGFLVHNEGALPHLAGRVRTRTELGEVGLDVVALCPPALARRIPGLTDSIELPAAEIGETAARVLCETLTGVRTATTDATPTLIRPRLASGATV